MRTNQSKARKCKKTSSARNRAAFVENVPSAYVRTFAYVRRKSSDMTSQLKHNQTSRSRRCWLSSNADEFPSSKKWRQQNSGKRSERSRHPRNEWQMASNACNSIAETSLRFKFVICFTHLFIILWR